MTAGRTLNTLSQDWGTPEKYVKAVRDFFGGPPLLIPVQMNTPLYRQRPSTDCQNLMDSGNLGISRPST
jgi:hypothetical protein